MREMILPIAGFLETLILMEIAFLLGIGCILVILLIVALLAGER